MSDLWVFHSSPPEPDARIAYGKGPLRFGELRLPQRRVDRKDEAETPVVIVIHGGFWLAEYDLGHVTHLAAHLTTLGFATWCLEFRRLGNFGGGYPGAFHDVARGADHLRELADEHRLDLGDVTALGHSAGGHLALWLAARGKLAAGSPLFTEDPLPITRVVSLAGVVDLRACHERGLGAGVARQFMGGSPDAEPERYAEASPAELLPFGSRQLLFHGDSDHLVPVELSRDYQRRAAELGEDVSLVELPGSGHFELIDPHSDEWKAVETALVGDAV